MSEVIENVDGRENVDTSPAPELTNEVITQRKGSISVTADATPAVDPMDTLPPPMPEKFAKADDPQKALLEAYHALEKKLGAPKDEQEEVSATPDVGDDNIPSDDGTETSEPSDETPTEIESKWSKVWEEQNGSYTEEQYVEMAKESGQPVSEVKAFVDWKANQASQAVDSKMAEIDTLIIDTAGGQQQYEEMAKWANDTLSAEELTTIETMLSSPELAVKGAGVLKALYSAKANVEPSVKVEGKASVTSYDGFTNNAEYLEARANPLYNTSPKYQRQVDEKLIKMMKRDGEIS